MRIAVCDDEAKEREQFLQAMKSWDPDLTAEQFPSGASLLKAAKTPPPFDIIFLDIYLPGENGIDIASTLEEISPTTGIAFVTTSEDHAVAAFSVNALHYLVKPVTAEGIAAAFSRLRERILNTGTLFLFLWDRPAALFFSTRYAISTVSAIQWKSLWPMDSDLRFGRP